MSPLLIRTLESVAGDSSLMRDGDWGNTFFYSMEPWARLSTYSHRIGRGQPFPESLEHDAGRNPHLALNVHLRESTDELPTNTVSIRWPRPWYLPEPWSVAQLFLATWCHSKSGLLSPCT
jgi:hypothetical protein